MKLKPIYKFNNGNSANLCLNCRTIIHTGKKSKALFCLTCLDKFKQLTLKTYEKRYA